MALIVKAPPLSDVALSLFGFNAQCPQPLGKSLGSLPLLFSALPLLFGSLSLLLRSLSLPF